MFRNTERSLRLAFAPRRARLLRRIRFFEFRAAIVGTVHRLPGTFGPNHEFPCLCIAKKYLPYFADDLISTLLRQPKRPRRLMRGQGMAVVDFDRLRHMLIIVRLQNHTSRSEAHRPKRLTYLCLPQHVLFLLGILLYAAGATLPRLMSRREFSLWTLLLLVIVFLIGQLGKLQE
jgi:hypothetical protein